MNHGYISGMQYDGKIVIAGVTYDANYIADWLILRLDSAGTLDTTFGTNEITIIDFYIRDDIAHAVTIQPDGKIVVSGTYNDTVSYCNKPAAMRLTSSGNIDSTFGINGVAMFTAV